MKKIIVVLVGLLFFVPSFSFAATYTPAQISAMEQLLIQLESELASLLSGSSIGTSVVGTQPVGGTATSTGSIQVSVGTTVAYAASAGRLYKTSITVTNDTDSTIYIPTAINYGSTTNAATNTPGITYTMSGGGYPAPVFTGSSSATVTCSPMTVMQGVSGYIQVCSVAPHQASEVDVQITASFSGGSFAASLTSMDYTTSSTNSSFTVLPLPNNQSNFIY